MQREKFHQALVTDEYGSVTGIVSLEDLLEELVGEITDEYDRGGARGRRGRRRRLPRVSGKTSIDDLNDELDAELPDEDWDTVAGLVLDLFGKIPDERRGVPASRAGGSAPRRSRAGGSRPCW